MKLKDIKENGILIYRDMIVDKSEISEVNEHDDFDYEISM